MQDFSTHYKLKTKKRRIIEEDLDTLDVDSVLVNKTIINTSVKARKRKIIEEDPDTFSPESALANKELKRSSLRVRNAGYRRCSRYREKGFIVLRNELKHKREKQGMAVEEDGLIEEISTASERSDYLEEDDISSDASHETPLFFPVVTSFGDPNNTKIFAQMLVSAVIDEDFLSCALDEEYFQVAWRAVSDKLRSRQQLLDSSAWLPSFRKDLHAYPDAKRTVGRNAGHDCDACERSNHPATVTVVLSGCSYDKSSFKSLPVAAEEKVWELGCFCAKRSLLFHKIVHFPYHCYKRFYRKVKSLEPLYATSVELVEHFTTEPIMDQVLSNPRRFLHIFPSNHAPFRPAR
ncbi:uncharacterized protein LOC135121400 isoform X2 [Zophobas morio]|uniref:uncharacterized protein LOC135121400 isoform X2 n=1 Tax=Zophobas morio TaxID=2755281 RepID=UPI003083983F